MGRRTNHPPLFYGRNIMREIKETFVHALDLSLNSTGVCIFTNDGRLMKAQTIDTHALGETKLKLNMIGKEFIRLGKLYPPSVVVIEQGFTLYNASTQMIFRVHGMANYIYCQYEQIYYPATTVKKTVGGKGNMTKEEIRAVILKEHPEIKFYSLDESDAYAIGLTYFIQKGILHAKENVQKKDNIGQADKENKSKEH
jgi:Holliday junction resolvasome RuvABC endonuclease subunit